MNNIKTKAVRLSLAAAGLVLAASAHATANFVDVTSLVTSSIVGDMASFTLEPGHTATFTDFAASPVQVAWYAGNLPGGQGEANILSKINGSNLFGLPGANISYVAGADGVFNHASISLGQHYDYLAVHFASGEMLFHWAGGAPVPFVINSDKLSNYRAFTSPVPEPETYGMLLAGLGLVGFLARRRKAA